jgi:hypothetical protein
MVKKALFFLVLGSLSPWLQADPLSEEFQTTYFKKALHQKNTWFTQSGYSFSSEPLAFSEPVIPLLNPVCLKATCDIIMNWKIDISRVDFLLQKPNQPDSLIEGQCIAVWYLNYDKEMATEQLVARDRIKSIFGGGNATKFKHYLEVSDCEILDDDAPEIHDHVYTHRYPFSSIESGFIRYEWTSKTKL